MKKRLLTLAIVVFLTAGALVVYLLASEKVNPSPQTDPIVQCQTNEDCRCCNFNGAKFLPGDTPGRCCTPDSIDQFSCFNFNIPPYHCASLYV